MQISRLNDAAIALARILTRANVRFGIFGGYAIAVRGGPRESKDVDCIAAGVTKAQLVELLNGKDGFAVIPQTREDYVAFMWSDSPRRDRAVLVEIFPERFSGAQHTMNPNVVHSEAISVVGQSGTQSATLFLDPFHLFKGKLGAAATRGKFHDSADLRWLEDRYGAQIAARRGELSLVYVGLALKRYPELERLFQRLGMDINEAKKAASGLDINSLPLPPSGGVQRRLLA